GPAKLAPLALKKFAGNVLTLVRAAGTPSQLISRRPTPWSWALARLFGSPNRARNCTTVDVMSPVPRTTWNDERTYPLDVRPMTVPVSPYRGPAILLPS